MSAGGEVGWNAGARTVTMPSPMTFTPPSGGQLVFRPAANAPGRTHLGIREVCNYLRILAATGSLHPRRPPMPRNEAEYATTVLLSIRQAQRWRAEYAMAYRGLRCSEFAGLRVGDVDLVRNRVRIIERATEVGGRMDVDAPKGLASARQVAIPRVPP